MTLRKSLSLSRLLEIATSALVCASRRAASRLISTPHFWYLSITSVLASMLLLLSIPTMASSGLAFQSQSLQLKAQTEPRTESRVGSAAKVTGTLLDTLAVLM